jgi:hypothetical protein
VDRFHPCSLEDLVTQTDLLAKLCELRILSEESDYGRLWKSLEDHGQKDSSYTAKLAMEAPCMALPALVAWETLAIACDVLGPLNPPTTSPLVTLLNKLLDRDRSSRLTIATLNYDLVLEKAALQRINTGCAFRYGEADEAALSTVEVLKLHGSLNWKEAAPDFRPNVPDWARRSGWLDVVLPFASGSKVVQPSLLLPTLFKQEINIDYQTDPRAMYYKGLWEVFAKRLSTATALLTVGCSFPDTDSHLRMVIGSAVNAGGKLQRVVVCVKEDTTPTDRLAKALGGRYCRTLGIIERTGSNIEVREDTEGLDALVKGDAVDWLMHTA